MTGVVADLYGNFHPLSHKVSFQERLFIPVQCAHFNQLVERIGPRILIEVPNMMVKKNEKTTSAKLDVDLQFNCMEDFRPGALIDRVPQLKELFRRLNVVDNVLNMKQGIQECCAVLKNLKPIEHEYKGKPYPKNHVKKDKKFAYPTPHGLMEAELEEIVAHMASVAYENYPGLYEKEEDDVDREKLVRAVLAQTIGAMQRLLEMQINLILKHPTFKKLEATYLGLKILFDTIKQNNKNKNIQLKVLPATWKEIALDIQKAPSVQRSSLFTKIYDELDVPGGLPFTNIIWDYEISHLVCEQTKIPFLETLIGLSEIASASFCPFAFSALPELFGLNSYGDFAPNMKLSKIFSQPEYMKWNEFRKRLEARFMNIVVPRVLARLPYYESFSVQPNVTNREYTIKEVVKRNFYFIENIFSEDDYLWTSAAYSFSSVLVRSFAHTGWFEYIRGVSKTDDEIDGTLPNVVYGAHGNIPQLFDRNQWPYHPSQATSLLVLQNNESDLDDHGFIPVSADLRFPSGVFFHVSSLYDTGVNVNKTEKWAAGKLASSTNYILCGSRFAHYIRVISREKIGGLTSAIQLQNYLQKWVTSYIKKHDGVGLISSENKIQSDFSPLAAGSVYVKENQNKLGSFEIEMNLQPRLQSENISTVIQLISEIKSRS